MHKGDWVRPFMCLFSNMYICYAAKKNVKVALEPHALQRVNKGK